MKDLTVILRGICLILIGYIVGCTNPSGTESKIISEPIPFTIESSSSQNIQRKLQSGSVLLYADPNILYSPDSFLDLDTGVIGKDNSNADIKFSVSLNSELKYSIQPINRSFIGSFWETEPNFEGCQQEISSFLPYSINSLDKGNYLCVLTNRGHLAQLEIENLNHLGEGSVRIRFITWDRVFENDVQSLTTVYPIPATLTIPPPPTLAPTGTVEPSVNIYQNGSAKLYATFDSAINSTSFLDLDSGTVSDSDASDIQFVISRGGGGMYFYYLVPSNGAKVGLMGRTEPSSNMCQQSASSFASTSIDVVVSGTYICVVTNQERLARVLIEDTNLPDGSIRLSFITWE